MASASAAPATDCERGERAPEDSEVVLGVENGSKEEFEKPAPLEHGNRSLNFVDLFINYEELVGRGAIGTVYKGRWKHWNGVVAIKEVQETYKDCFDKELEYLSKLKHPNIIKLYGSCTNDLHWYIIEEFAEHGSLYDHIAANKGKPDIVWSLRWAADITEGMCYLHENDVVHRDLKSPIVLLTSEWIAKISSFKISCDLPDGSRTVSKPAGTYRWMAPEAIKEERYSKSCDLFSFGMVLWELTTHKLPFEGKSEFEVLTAIVDGKLPVIPAQIDGYIVQLIEQCWSMDRKERPSFYDVRKSLKKNCRQQCTEDYKPLHAIPPAEGSPSIGPITQPQPQIRQPLTSDQPEPESGVTSPTKERENRELNFSDVDLGEMVGGGGCGTVFRGNWKHHDGPVAIKEFQAGGKRHFETERKRLSDLNHPNIMKVYGWCFSNRHYYIVAEFAENGSLKDHIAANKGKPDMVWSLRWAAEITEGMCYLHEKSVVHRDLKPANILLTSERIVKICDFNLARVMDHSTAATGATGTCRYMAPEVFQSQTPWYSKSCDLFSFGMVLWELTTHKKPFKGKSDFAVQSNILAGERPVIPKTIDGYFCQLIEHCWHMDRKKRPSFADVRTSLKEKRYHHTDQTPLNCAEVANGFKWTDKQGAEKIFKPTEMFSDKWEDLGKQFGYAPAVLRGYERECLGKNEGCFKKVIDRWLEDGSDNYAQTWSGLCEALKDVGGVSKYVTDFEEAIRNKK